MEKMGIKIKILGQLNESKFLKKMRWENKGKNFLHAINNDLHPITVLKRQSYPFAFE